MASRGALFVGLDGSGNGLTPSDGRRALGALYGVTARPLLTPSATQSSSNMQITVAQNVWQLPDPTDAASTFISPMDSFVVTPAAGPGSGSRIDSIVIKQDNPQNGDTDPYSTPSLIAGTTSPPSIPAGYYEAARITVPAGASNAAACTVTFTNASGLMPAPLQGAATSGLPNGTVVGQRAFVAGIEYRWNGTVWKPFECDWTTYTPSVVNNVNVGSTGNADYRYKFANGDLKIRGRFTYGGTGMALATGPIYFVVPNLGVGFEEVDFGNAGTGILNFASTSTNLLRVAISTVSGARVVIINPVTTLTQNGAAQIGENGSNTWPFATPTAGCSITGEIVVHLA